MRLVNSGEWGDDLPPHPSPSDGHGKPVPDSLGGGTNGVKDVAGEGSRLLVSEGGGRRGG